MKYFWIILCLGLISCSNGNSSKERAKENEGNFPYVEIPTYIQNRDEAIRFLARNFWKPYFKAAAKENSLYNLDSTKFEEAYARYASAINLIEGSRKGKDAASAQKIFSTVAASQKNLFKMADSLYLAGHKRLLGRLLEISERYLYNPNSPYLNEETYIPALEAIMELKSMDNTAKMAYKWQLELASMNRIGTKAADFEFLQKKGNTFKKGTLHNIDAQYLLLYFNNPDCNSCRGQQSILLSDPAFVNIFESGKIKVLSMYIDEQADLWEKHYNEAPRSSNWIYARDQKLILRDNGLYGIRAIPSMYLLDREKNVILKDATAEKVVQYFNMINRN